MSNEQLTNRRRKTMPPAPPPLGLPTPEKVRKSLTPISENSELIMAQSQRAKPQCITPSPLHWREGALTGACASWHSDGRSGSSSSEVLRRVFAPRQHAPAPP